MTPTAPRSPGTPRASRPRSRRPELRRPSLGDTAICSCYCLNEEPGPAPSSLRKVPISRAPPGLGCHLWSRLMPSSQGRGAGARGKQSKPVGRAGGAGTGNTPASRAVTGPDRSAVSPLPRAGAPFPRALPSAPPSAEERGGFGTNPVEKKWPHIFRDVFNIVLAARRVLRGQRRPDMKRRLSASWAPGSWLLTGHTGRGGSRPLFRAKTHLLTAWFLLNTPGRLPGPGQPCKPSWCTGRN